MNLAKDCIDIGLQTNQRDPMLEFWGNEIGLPYEELLKVGGGSHQHRHGLKGSVFKLNHVRDPLPTGASTGYDGLLIADEAIDEPTTELDPDGNRVTLVPQGYAGISGIGIEMVVSSLPAFQVFYRDVLQMQQHSEREFSWGTTRFFLSEDQNHEPCQDMRGQGYRYITVQVWDVDTEHQGILDRGGDEGRAPFTLGTTARISFVKDPDGNWIEVSQRASLTGELPSNQE